MLLLTALLVSCSCHHAFAGPTLPSQTCSVSQGCEVHQDNLIQDLEGVELVEECRQLCSDSSECNMVSHFGGSSSPLPNHCLLLRSCPSLHDCQDCQTESRVCFGSCNEQFEGKVMENELETIIDAVDEPSCLQSCQQNAACSHYTFYTAEDTNYPSMCLLLSGLLGPVTSCEHCRTGKPDCSTPDCSFSVGSDAAMQTSFMFTESTGIGGLRGDGVGCGWRWLRQLRQRWQRVRGKRHRPGGIFTALRVSWRFWRGVFVEVSGVGWG